MLCKKCGMEIDTDSDYCKYCGSKQRKLSVPNYSENLLGSKWIRRIFNWIYESEHSKRNLIIICCLAFVISIFISLHGAWGTSVSVWIRIGMFFLTFLVWCIELLLVIPFLIGLLLDSFTFCYLLYQEIKNK